MKKTLNFLLTSMLLSAVLTSCSDDSSTSSSGTSSSGASSNTSASSAPKAGQTEKEADGIITMGGSTSVEAIIEVMEEVYEGASGLDMSYAPTGSSTGVQGAMDTTLDIGLASRSLKEDEIAAGVEAITFALDGIAVVVNSGNTVTDISMEDLAKICSGDITNWSELGGADGEIMLIGRDSASGTRDGFESIVGVEVETYAEEHASTGAVIASIQGIPGAIGYVSLSAVDEKVNALTVDGVAATEETVKDGSYPIQRPFIFVVNTAIFDPEVEAFVAWALSEEAGVLVESKGAVAPEPVVNAEVEKQIKEADGVITMGGSTSVESIIEVMEEVYEGAEGIDMSYAPTGSSTGVQGAIDGTLDIGLASRGLKSSEEEAGVEAITFALDGIAVVVNAANTVTDISMEDLAKICSGDITNWSELGGEDGEIMLIGRDSASGTRDGFESIVGVEVETYAEEHASTGAVIASIQGIPGAIGYVSLSAVDEKITALSVDGVVASEATVKDGSYPIQRPFIFVVNSAVSDPDVDAFLEWALGDEAGELVVLKGAVAPK